MTALTLTVVGCSGTIPGPHSAASCYLVEFGSFALVLDLGSGALGPLQRYVALDAVDALLLSHLHPDHSADLGPYFVALRYAPGQRAITVPVYGPKGTAEHLASGYPGSRSAADFGQVFDFNDLSGTTISIGPLQVTTAQTAHPVECWATRIAAGGRVLVFTADTGPSAAVTALARDADLLLAEAGFVAGHDNPPDLHLTGEDAGDLAANAQVGRLVLTHVPPWHDSGVALMAATSRFGGPTEVAEPGARYVI